MPKSLRRLSERNPFLSVLYNLPRLAKGYQPIYLDYPVNPVPRYGYGKPLHPELSGILASGSADYVRLLTDFLKFESNLLAIPVRQPKTSEEPCWVNKWLGGLDTFALYGFVAACNPAVYIEVGSGFSTKVVRRAIRDLSLSTRLVSIDPSPRAEIDRLCDEVIRQPLEDCDLSVFDCLGPGDIFFMDGSHRSFMNSDVTVFFLEILPRFKPEVFVHIHDIYLPFDYPPDRAYWYYSEQYLLAASLLAGHQGYDIVLPNNYISNTPEASSVLEPLWASPQLVGVSGNGSSFWLKTR
ncbi:MAG TPA: class I SAM-dependent methyltransferase [Candidatus Limnocylindrales bacterium]|jgi:hypothetical protein|nr:class I SAM-dependent methyltransferase [Candidatus Limnocylindrales bacterium]